LWVQLRFRDGIVVNRKAVYRVLKQQGWFVHQRSATPRPRVRGWVSRAKEAERAVEAACLQRFETLRPVDTPILRSDNGLLFQSRHVRQACQDYRLQQEFITPYTPEQNGIIERFFRSLKEECVWQHTFQTLDEARRVVRDWMRWYNEARPHQALGYRSPVQYRAQQSTQVA
jgi:putative transposase